jgi:dimethylsulfone monooxygenase
MWIISFWEEIMSSEARNPLKFGIFMPSVSNNPNISRYKPVPDDWTYESNKQIALAAEQAGFGFIFPISRWKGFGGDINYHGHSLETMTWASALLAVTSTIEVYSTVHVPAFNPVVAAKMGATLDHIGGGRWGINLVSGWCRGEFEMMGVDILDHDKRYERTEDFIKVLKGLWTEEPGSFDFESEHYTVRGGYVQPQPQRRPHPPIVNAGSSDDAREMVARQCDWSFICPVSLDNAEEMTADIKARAAKQGRKVGVISMAQPIWYNDDPQKAYDEKDKIVEQADWVALNNWADGLGMESGSFDDHAREMFAFGAGSPPLLGTAQDVADGMAALYERGIDGVLMCFNRYLEDTIKFGEEVVPLLKNMGLVEKDT